MVDHTQPQSQTRATNPTAIQEQLDGRAGQPLAQFTRAGQKPAIKSDAASPANSAFRTDPSPIPPYFPQNSTSTCGLRISAGVNRQVSGIDRARMQLRMRGGNGAQDRSVPPPARTLTVLRRHWRTYRNPVWRFHTSAAALQHLAQDPRCLGGQIGMLGVVPTWTCDRHSHPHVHALVPALALAPDGKRGRVGNSDVRLHVNLAGPRCLVQCRAAVRQTPWASQVDARLGQAVGGGSDDHFDYNDCRRP